MECVWNIIIVEVVLSTVCIIMLTVYMSNMTVVLREAGTVYPSRTPEFTPGFLVRFVLPIYLGLLCCPIMCLCSEFRVVMSVTFPHKHDVAFVFTSFASCL